MAESSPESYPSAPDLAATEWTAARKHNTIEYDDESGTYRASYDSASRSVQEAVVSTVALVSETPPLQMPPLYSVVDPEALETLLTPTEPRSATGDVSATLSYGRHEVTIYNHGLIEVRQPRTDSRGRASESS